MLRPAYRLEAGPLPADMTNAHHPCPAPAAPVPQPSLLVANLLTSRGNMERDVPAEEDHRRPTVRLPATVCWRPRCRPDFLPRKQDRCRFLLTCLLHVLNFYGADALGQLEQQRA